MPGPAGYVYARAAGVFGPFRRLWDGVEAGDPAGAVRFLDDPARPPEVVRFKASGAVFSRRAPGRVVRGDCAAVVGAPYERG
ncbi:MAG TPA: hypothetical protein VFG47_01370 [Geminicoccaceae bacterium]|nr:hypothetical protein [Geminicoccaceae bacterium]